MSGLTPEQVAKAAGLVPVRDDPRFADEPSGDCPLCPHPESEHGTYGCLADWRWEGEHLARGCPCARRRLIDHTRSLPVFGLPFPRGTGG